MEVLTSPTSGTLSGTAPDLSYAPNADFSGSDSFTFRVADSQGAFSAAATVSILINPASSGGNHAPATSGLNLELGKNQSVSGTLVASDADADPLTYSLLQGPASGTLNSSFPDFSYTPNPEFEGTDQFTYQVQDPFGGVATGTVSLVVGAPGADGGVQEQQAVGGCGCNGGGGFSPAPLLPLGGWDFTSVAVAEGKNEP